MEISGWRLGKLPMILLADTVLAVGSRPFHLVEQRSTYCE